jgi:hypothetical protein
MRWTPVQRGVALAAFLAGVAVRWVMLAATLPTFDETFTGVNARLPIGDIPGALRARDSHPPLDYLMRHVFAGTDSTFWLRFPSAVLGTATLVLVLWWMRDRGWFGVFVVVFSSFAAIQVLYAREARMYALVIFVGTVVAVVAERWLQESATKWSVIAGTAVLVGVFGHVSVLFLVAGALLVPGLRTDREAWTWRVALGVPALVWAVVWGPSFRDQLDHQPASWIPHTSLTSARDAIAGQLTMYDGLAVLVLVAVVVGGVALLTRQLPLGRVWVCLFVAPAAAEMVLGFWQHLLLPRSLAFAAWAPVVAVAALVGRCVEDRPPWLSARVGAVGAIAVSVLAVGSVGAAASYEESSTAARQYVRSVAQPGDTLMTHPAFLGPMLRWDHPIVDGGVGGVSLEDDTWSGVVVGAAPTGRTWVVVPDTYAYRPPAGLRTCPDHDRYAVSEYAVYCFDGPPDP